MTVARLLRDHLDRTREPQAAFARRVGLTPQTVSQLVRGEIKVPTADVRRKLAAALALRHVDILVAAGELTPEEIGPLPASHISDHRLQEIVNVWPALHPNVQSTMRGLLDLPGAVESEEPRVAAVAR